MTSTTADHDGHSTYLNILPFFHSFVQFIFDINSSVTKYLQNIGRVGEVGSSGFMWMQIVDFAVDIIRFLERRFGNFNSSIFQLKIFNSLAFHSSIQFGGDNLSDAIVDELIKGINMLLGKSLKSV